MENRKKFAILLGVFLLAYFLPIDHPKVSNAIFMLLCSLSIP